MRKVTILLFCAALCGAQLCEAQAASTSQSTTTTTSTVGQTTETTTVKTKAKRPRHKRKVLQTQSTTTTATPAGPKTAAELQTDVQAKLKAGKLATDPINVAVQGNTITLTGSIARAQHKGVATRLARSVARADGWKDFHVDNQLEVQDTSPATH